MAIPPRPTGPPPAGDPEGPRGSIRPTGHAPLAVLAAVGLVGGWSVRLVVLRLGWAQPQVDWPAIALLAFLAVVLGLVAVLTRRVVRRDRASLAPHQALNRLLLAKACALVGALVAGAYAGYALAQLGVPTPAAQLRLGRSGLAALAAAAVVAAALALEHACRVPDPEK